MKAVWVLSVQVWVVFMEQTVRTPTYRALMVIVMHPGVSTALEYKMNRNWDRRTVNQRKVIRFRSDPNSVDEKVSLIPCDLATFSR